MAPLPVFRALRSTIALPSICLRLSCRRSYSVRPEHVNPEVAGTIRSRLTRITSRLPRFLQRYTTPLISAPLTHISAFLLLHELTAIVPLFALAGIFHYTQWLPPYISEGKWISNGVEMFGNYFRKKGWLGDEEYARRHKWWGRGEGGVRVVVEYVSLQINRWTLAIGLDIGQCAEADMMLKIRNSICHHQSIDTGQVDRKRFGNALVC